MTEKRYFTRANCSLLVALWLLFTLLPQVQAQVIFIDLGLLPGGNNSTALGISENGLKVMGVGNSSQGWRAFRWDPSQGMHDIGGLAGTTLSQPKGISASGDAIVGFCRSNSDRPFLWTSSVGMREISGLTGASESWATATSHDGSIVAGTSFFQLFGSQPQAFKWTDSGMAEALGLLDGETESWADGISADGSVIVGQCRLVEGVRAFRWTSFTGKQNLGVPPGGINSAAVDTNIDGSVVVGFYSSPNGMRAFRWSQSGGIRELMRPPSSTSALANCVSLDGQTIGGYCTIDGTFQACIWSDRLGWINLNALLPSLGVNMLGWELSEVTGVSANGSSLTGVGLYNGHYRAWVVQGLPCSDDCLQVCDSPDFNNDEVLSGADIAAFLSIYSEDHCIPMSATCNDIDFNNDASLFDPCDINSFLLVFSEGPCTPCGV